MQKWGIYRKIWVYTEKHTEKNYEILKKIEKIFYSNHYLVDYSIT
jgi:hypothetical protein